SNGESRDESSEVKWFDEEEYDGYLDASQWVGNDPTIFRAVDS
ncbi:hypothetical protein Tco_0515596, partial [Tanacetum coccineum]